MDKCVAPILITWHVLMQEAVPILQLTLCWWSNLSRLPGSVTVKFCPVVSRKCFIALVCQVPLIGQDQCTSKMQAPAGRLTRFYLKKGARLGEGTMAVGLMWHVCDGWKNPDDTHHEQWEQHHKREATRAGGEWKLTQRAPWWSPVLGRIAALMNFLAEHLGGRGHQAAFVKCHVFLPRWPRGLLAWMATWFYLWSYGLSLFPTNGRRYCPSRDARSTNRALTCKRWIHTSWWQLWSVCLIPKVSWGISKAPCVRICHSVSEPGCLMKPHTWDHSFGTPPGFHKAVGVRRVAFYPSAIFDELWFPTTGPMVGISATFAEFSEWENGRCIFEKLHSSWDLSSNFKAYGLMRNLDLIFSERRTFVSSDVCMTLRSFCELHSSNSSQDFCALP